MPAKKYLNQASGRLTQVTSVVTSAGATNDGDIVALDPSGKLDVSVMPVGVGQNTVSVVASEALATNNIVNIHNVSGVANVRKADATTVGKEAVGFVKSSVASAATATVFTSGNIITGLSGLTPGARQYLSLTAGNISETPPSASGNVVMCLGSAISATSMIFEPEEPITLA